MKVLDRRGNQLEVLGSGRPGLLGRDELRFNLRLGALLSSERLRIPCTARL